jgi:hypothetical protein
MYNSSSFFQFYVLFTTVKFLSLLRTIFIIVVFLILNKNLRHNTNNISFFTILIHRLSTFLSFDIFTIRHFYFSTFLLFDIFIFRHISFDIIGIRRFYFRHFSFSFFDFFTFRHFYFSTKFRFTVFLLNFFFCSHSYQLLSCKSDISSFVLTIQNFFDRIIRITPRKNLYKLMHLSKATVIENRKNEDLAEKQQIFVHCCLST